MPASSTASPRIARAGAGEQLGHPQRQPVVRPRRPLLQVRHLHADGGVDPVGRLDQAGQQDREERRVAVVGVDRGADRVDPRAVLRAAGSATTMQNVSVK